MSFKRPEVPRIKLPDAAIEKWGEACLKEGFIPFPKKLLRVLSEVFEEPSFQILQTLLAIVDYIREDMKRPPSLDYLAFIAGQSEDVFRANLKALVAMGLVSKSGYDSALDLSLKGLKETIEKQIKYTDHPPAKMEMNPE